MLQFSCPVLQAGEELAVQQLQLLSAEKRNPRNARAVGPLGCHVCDDKALASAGHGLATGNSPLECAFEIGRSPELALHPVAGHGARAQKRLTQLQSFFCWLNRNEALTKDPLQLLLATCDDSLKGKRDGALPDR